MNNDFFLRMCKEAQEELAQGEKGWKECDPNVLIMACFGMFFNHMTHKIVRPLWWAAGSIFTAVVGYLIHLFVG